MGLSSLNFGLPFFLRVLLPGAVAAVAALPLLGPPLGWGLRELGLQADFAGVVLLSVLTLGLGLVLWTLDDPIYELYEGRRWPRFLSEPLRGGCQSSVDQLLRRFESVEPETAEGEAENSEIWAELRQFPVGPDNQPVALRPTKVGNILMAYEQYPERRYGMDAVFYWPRLVLMLDRDAREEIDRNWATADGWMHVAAATLGAGTGR